MASGVPLQGNEVQFPSSAEVVSRRRGSKAGEKRECSCWGKLGAAGGRLHRGMQLDH